MDVFRSSYCVLISWECAHFHRTHEHNSCASVWIYLHGCPNGMYKWLQMNVWVYQCVSARRPWTYCKGTILMAHMKHGWMDAWTDRTKSDVLIGVGMARSFRCWERVSAALSSFSVSDLGRSPAITLLITALMEPISTVPGQRHTTLSSQLLSALELTPSLSVILSPHSSSSLSASLSISFPLSLSLFIPASVCASLIPFISPMPCPTALSIVLCCMWDC